MKYLVILLSKILLIVWCVMPVTGYAGAREEYDEAYKVYVAAGACLAAYSDRMGKLAYEYLEQEGWQIEPYIQNDTKADARFLLAKKNLPDGKQPIYILAVVGTENIRDIKTDLKVDKVYFAGHNPQEFAQNAERKDMADTAPKVHLGFHQYVQAALTAQTTENTDATPKLLSELLLANKERKVYLVGHSLGGAAATLGGARLLSMGVQPEQIEVVTFGAPAVGNEAFAHEFEPVLPVTRVVISGDPVTGVLQKLVGGYRQFGRQINWEMPDTMINNDPHRIAEYLDLAIKNYYQKRQQALQAEIIASLPTTSTNDTARIYVAPIKNYLPSSLQSEFWYMQQALEDEYRKVLPGYVLADQPTDSLLITAAEQGCKWVIVPEISGYKLKNEQNCYYITLQQVVYDTDTGSVINMASFSTATNNLTPLEALIHDAKNMSSDSSSWLTNF